MSGLLERMRRLASGEVMPVRMSSTLLADALYALEQAANLAEATERAAANGQVHSVTQRTRLRKLREAMR
jgi:hypothetical protein